MDLRSNSLFQYLDNPSKFLTDYLLNEMFFNHN
jgi:hypothetical protein